MESAFCFVQFLHPGPEERPEGDHYGWNRKNVHRRRFLRQRGDYLDGENIRHRNVDLTFWGEWEATGRAEGIPHTARIDQGPQYICSPSVGIPPTSSGNARSCSTGSGEEETCPNTDPFVFGDQFLYSNCRQRTFADNPSQLQALVQGSIILFGSCINHQFCLDTVFVVEQEDSRREAPRRYQMTRDQKTLREWTSDTFMTVTGNNVPEDTDFTLHTGRTYNGDLNTPFSFVPCRRYDDGNGIFARPEIDLREFGNFIRPGMTQGYALNRGITPDMAQELWRAVRDQVWEAGLELGIRFDLPPA